jgi:DivIVA domain-containing protein
VDRDEIERHDFPTGRRGYDPASVDEHLRRVADQFERLRGRPPAPPPTLASGTSDQVRVILEAAERSADELRARAGEEASGHVERVKSAADGLMGRLDQLEGELQRLLEGLRASGERLAEGLAELQAEAAGASGSLPVEEDFAAAAPAPDPDVPPAPRDDLDGLTDADEAGARLIALNMALGGSPREETARYLAEHFALADPEALLDDVYSRTQG